MLVNLEDYLENIAKKKSVLKLYAAMKHTLFNYDNFTLSFFEFNISYLISFSRASLTAILVTARQASLARYLNPSTSSNLKLKVWNISFCSEIPFFMYSSTFFNKCCSLIFKNDMAVP